MGKVHLKGGQWTNVEDEILKAAVMKYGLNQWARISSLLTRKTPKQCKARWNEWLDPAVRKTGWTKEEEERLLHLAKVMPQQWKSIAPIVGRTAEQCLTHYEHMLDQANRCLDEEDTASQSISELSKPKEGERDHFPESRPARPDPVDMDEEEKEMLAEARARLANTQGKKAKRKARMAMLEAQKAETAAKKQQDLASAGITAIVKRSRKRAGIDYNSEIPFETLPVPGIHDTLEELAKPYESRGDSDHRKKTRDLMELEARKQDAANDKQRVSKGYLPMAVERQLRSQQSARAVQFKVPLPMGTEHLSKIKLDEVLTPSSVLTNFDSTPLSMKLTPSRDKSSLQSKFHSLPKPKNDYQILRPDL